MPFERLNARLERARASFGLESLALVAADGITLKAPELPPDVSPAEFVFYRSEVPSHVLGHLRAEPAPEDSKAFHEFVASLVPPLRFRSEKLDLYFTLEAALEKLVESRRENPSRDSWTGLYLVAGDHLELGPYRGFVTDHHVIPLNRGLCGAAVSEGRTVVSKNVRTEASYLACSLETRSEIVIPLRDAWGRIWGELDIDSPVVDAYSERDRADLERWCEEIGMRIGRMV